MDKNNNREYTVLDRKKTEDDNIKIAIGVALGTAIMMHPAILPYVAECTVYAMTFIAKIPVFMFEVLNKMGIDLGDIIRQGAIEKHL